MDGEAEYLKINTVQRVSSPVSFNTGMRHRTNSGSNFAQPIARSLHTVGTHGLLNHHILSVDMFNKQQLREIFSLADSLKFSVRKERPLEHILKVSFECFKLKEMKLCTLFHVLIYFIDRVK